MAIKIDNKNLYRRIWNWQDVQKVILNWAVIRPNEQANVYYYVFNDFTWWWGGWGWLPQWWWWTWVEVTNDWVVISSGRQSWEIHYTDIMPSLANARKIEIVAEIGWDRPEQMQSMPLNMRIWNSNEWTNTHVDSTIYWYRWFYEQALDPIYWWPTSELVNFNDWDYTITTIVDMDDEDNPFATMSMEWPAGFSTSDLTQSFMSAWVDKIRAFDSFKVEFYNSITIKSIKFYVYNKDVIPTPPTPEPTPSDWVETWYHVPTYSELSWLYDLLATDLWLTMLSPTVLGYLHLPQTWFLDMNWSYTDLTGSGIYCSDFHNSRCSGWTIFWWIWSNMTALSTSIWANIRPFKDTYVQPDNTWTVEYWNLSTWWIFRDSVNWLISIFYWNKWYTMQDKNLWATVVWNGWDSVNANNCGNFYQWWNCYGFKITWAVTKSSTLVNTTGYWDWTLYTSETYITTGTSFWMSPVNPTLWS